jgi:thioredoxin-like negative regulator of GroEL
LALPDDEESELYKKLEAEPSSLELRYELAMLMIEKNRGGEAIEPLL